ncbi:hypothetical protein [Streptomyces sp. c-19]|uniref:hypothetical protein n=1 Tax=Streptomyces sp. c-19 TaxID=2789275 RepID=UPI0039806069
MRSRLERSLIVLPALTVVMATAVTSAAVAAPVPDRNSVAGKAGSSAGDPAPTACDNPVRTWYEIAGSSPAIHMKWPGTSFKKLVRTATFTIPGKEGVGWRYWETSS